MHARRRERMERLKTLRWVGRGLPKAQADRACPSELQFYKEYDRLLGQYMGRKDGVGMDLTLVRGSGGKELELLAKV